jgi:hypothetical protein
MAPTRIRPGCGPPPHVSTAAKVGPELTDPAGWAVELRPRVIAVVQVTLADPLGAAPLPPSKGASPCLTTRPCLMPLGCSRLSYCRTPGRTRPANGLLGRCASVPIPRHSSRPATHLPQKLGPSARHVPYAVSAWPMPSPLMSDSASGAALTHGSGALCAGGWSGLDCPHRQKPGPPRDPGTAAVARQDRGERSLVKADGPRRPGRRRTYRDDDTA